jgi:hypothetical protein
MNPINELESFALEVLSLTEKLKSVIHKFNTSNCLEEISKISSYSKETNKVKTSICSEEIISLFKPGETINCLALRKRMANKNGVSYTDKKAMDRIRHKIQYAVKRGRVIQIGSGQGSKLCLPQASPVSTPPVSQVPVPLPQPNPIDKNIVDQFLSN